MVMDPDSMEAEIVSLRTNKDLLEMRVRVLERKFDTLETSLWKRLWFRIDGWPGQRNLNAPRRHWRPWHRRH